MYYNYTVQIVLKEPVFKREDAYFLSNDEAFDRAMQKNVRYIQIQKEQGLEETDLGYLREAISDSLPTILHVSAFAPTISVSINNYYKQSGHKLPA